MKRTQLRPNDVLLNITGASIGRATFLPKDFKEGNVNQHVCIIRLPDEVLPEFAAMFLNSENGQKQIFSSQTGVTREGLNFSQVRGLWLPLIELEEQYEIVKIVNELFAKVNNFEKKYLEVRDKVQSLPFRILQEAFNGELVDSDIESEDIIKLKETIKAERINFIEQQKKEQTLIKKPMNQVKKQKLEEKLKSSFDNNAFYFNDIKDLFEIDYEIVKDEFYDLIRLNKISVVYDKESKNI